MSYIVHPVSCLTVYQVQQLSLHIEASLPRCQKPSYIYLCVYTDKLGARPGAWPLLWSKFLVERPNCMWYLVDEEGLAIKTQVGDGGAWVLIVQSSRYCEVKLGNSVDRWCGPSSMIVCCCVIQLCWQIRDWLIKQGWECRVETVKTKPLR